MPALLEIEGLKTWFETEAGTVRAVDDLTVSIGEGRTLGVVGESGSGKSVTSLTIMRLLPEVSARIAAGRVSFMGRDLVQLPEPEMREVRGRDVSMIFQEPGTSLNPVFRVGEQVIEAIRRHQHLNYQEARERTLALFKEVGLPAGRIDAYPHEMSGGQKQRVMIAMALSCNPKLLIADEPTTALDVTIQKQILDLLAELRDQRQMAILFITHDLGVIADVADDVAVMYKGKLVEYGPVEQIFGSPRHPYTKGLIACRPRPDSTYRILPTVADFMTVTTRADGELEIVEKTVTPERLEQLTASGRGRLLHPESVLEKQGYSAQAALTSPKDACLPDLTQPLLSVRDLHVHFPIKKGLLRRTVDHVYAVNGISFDVYSGQTLGLVGESGCGKTTTGRAIVGLVPITSGHVEFKGRSLAEYRALGSADWAAYRRSVQIIFQDPYSSLNPRRTVESMLVEAMAIHRLGNSHNDRIERAAQLLVEVGLETMHLRRYPHEFSGGQRQRLSIARALAVEPSFVICDESVSALDVSVQAQVLNLLKKLQADRGLTYIFISHDLSVVKFMSDMMAVMNAGQIVEFGPSDVIYRSPQHEYTRKLIASIPNPTLEDVRRRASARRQQ